MSCTSLLFLLWEIISINVFVDIFFQNFLQNPDIIRHIPAWHQWFSWIVSQDFEYD